MNWPEELIIKRDTTNTKVDNANDITIFIKNYSNIFVLEQYLLSLKTQTKLKQDEVIPIMEVTEKRINYLNEVLDKFKEEKNNSNNLSEFYENNIYFVNTILKNFKESLKLENKSETILIEFLRFCIDREKENYQNKLKTQNTFNECYNFYKKVKGIIEDSKIKKELDNIVEARDAVLNKKDENAMEYSEKGYLKVSTNGMSILNNDEDITNVGKAAFITTTIIIEATLAITFIMSLLALVK